MLQRSVWQSKYVMPQDKTFKLLSIEFTEPLVRGGPSNVNGDLNIKERQNIQWQNKSASTIYHLQTYIGPI